MSELTMCNYCTLELLKKWAKERGTHLVLSASNDGDVPWITVRYDNSIGVGVLAYFMELTTECVC